MTSLWGVPRDKVNEAWPLVSDYIKAALDRGGRHTEAEIRKDIESGTGQLWMAWDEDGVHGVCITYVLEHPRAKVCRIWLCTGKDRAKWQYHLETIENWAKSVDCTMIDAVVRPGWEKIMVDYKKTHVVLEREI